MTNSAKARRRGSAGRVVRDPPGPARARAPPRPGAFASRLRDGPLVVVPVLRRERVAADLVVVPVLRRALPLAVAERRERLDEAGGCREPLRPVMGRPRGRA